MSMYKREDLLEQSVELEQSELEARHIGEEVGAEIVRVHEAYKHAKGFFVGHLYLYFSKCRTARMTKERYIMTHIEQKCGNDER